MERDPVHKYEDEWYFWDEVWYDRIGPYETEELCRADLERYCKWLNIEREGNDNG
jgi:hypothetical protein